MREDNLYSAETIEYINIETEESYKEIDTVFCFYVPREWAENWCKNNNWISLDEFDTQYIWSNSWDMYCSAKEDNVLVRVEETEKRSCV